MSQLDELLWEFFLKYGTRKEFEHGNEAQEWLFTTAINTSQNSRIGVLLHNKLLKVRGQTIDGVILWHTEMTPKGLTRLEETKNEQTTGS